MKQLILSLCLLTMSAIQAKGGEVQDSLNRVNNKTTRQTLSINYGPGWITSKVADEYAGKEYSWRTGHAMNAEYRCVFASGYGFGVNASYSATDYPSALVTLFYIAPEFVMEGRKNHWLLKWTAGIGPVKFDDDYDSKWGLGYHASIGGEYLLTKHVGIGMDVQTKIANFGKADYGKYDVNGFSHFAVMAGIRFHL